MLLPLKLLRDDAGFVVSSELVLLGSITVLGLITGLTTMRDQVVQEVGDVADAFSEINQSYSYSAISGHTSFTAGGGFYDANDMCERPWGTDQYPGREPQCLEIDRIRALPEMR